MLLLAVFIKLAFATNVSTLQVNGYALYTNGTPFVGTIRVAINETLSTVSNTTQDGYFNAAFSSLTLTAGNKYTLVVIASDASVSSLIEEEFIA